MMDMNDADAKVNQLLAEIHRESEKLMREKKLNNEQARRAVYNRCKEKFEEIKRLSDEKCRIAADNYEFIDKHVIKLDSEMSKLRQKQDDGDQKSRKRKSTRDAEEKEPSRKKKKKDNEDLPHEAIPVVDMPVDPNEPTYCLCHQE
ncbi:Inhibitor of growth protein 5 [Aphelenchoides avenae]|nr:Inhibitor of growth protein 5 [Aphelenchus avenae]